MYKQLLKYQEVDATLREIEVVISGSEERKKTAQAKKFLDSVNETLAGIEKRSEELIGIFTELKKTHQVFSESAKEFESTLEVVEDENEINYMQKKADELSKKVQALETRINKLFEEIQALFAQYNSLKKKTAAAKQQYSEYGQKYKELKESKAEEMKKIEDELAVLEKSVDATLMAKYKAKRKDKMFPILVSLNDKNCGYCRMEVSMAEVSKLAKGEIIECDNCRHLIYKGE